MFVGPNSVVAFGSVAGCIRSSVVVVVGMVVVIDMVAFSAAVDPFVGMLHAYGDM